jgi:hypothetical protein
MPKELIILTERFLFTSRTSIGKLYFEYIKNYVQMPLATVKEFFCYTLEDTCRSGNIKVYGETALSGGLLCDVSLFENPHYGKTLIMHTEVDGRTIKFGNLTWIDCLFHNGIDISHTEACVLVGSGFNPALYEYGTKKILTEPTLYGGMKEKLRTFIEQKINEGFKIKAQFVNLDFNNS